MSHFSLFEFGLYSYKFEFRSEKFKYSVAIPFNYFEPKSTNRPPYRHIHAKYEVILILNQLSGVNKFLLIPPHYEHYTIPSNASIGLKVTSFQFSVEDILPTEEEHFLPVVNVLDNFRLLHEMIEVPDTFNGKERIKAIENELIDKSTAYFEKIQAEFMLLMVDLARLIRTDRPHRSNTPKRSFDEIRLDIIDCFFIENYYRPDCNRKELAEMLHISERHCYRILQENYHMTFSELLLRTRMEVAEAHRKIRRIRADEMSELVGYQSTYSFLTAYKKHFGYPYEPI